MIYKIEFKDGKGDWNTIYCPEDWNTRVCYNNDLVDAVLEQKRLVDLFKSLNFPKFESRIMILPLETRVNL
jgi:hypothetical protein